jgi:hypothetical protein
MVWRQTAEDIGVKRHWINGLLRSTKRLNPHPTRAPYAWQHATIACPTHPPRYSLSPKRKLSSMIASCWPVYRSSGAATGLFIAARCTAACFGGRACDRQRGSPQQFLAGRLALQIFSHDFRSLELAKPFDIGRTRMFTSMVSRRRAALRASESAILSLLASLRRLASIFTAKSFAGMAEQILAATSCCQVVKTCGHGDLEVRTSRHIRGCEYISAVAD